jgi:hypothetical protein
VTRRVLVVGYPKSGNTWLTRLTAELLNAPVRGFWNEPNREEIAEEGAWRISDTEVYKGHQTFPSARRDFDSRDIVYVVRDVRDIAVSGAHYFSFRPRSGLARIVNSVRRLLESETERVDRKLGMMIRTLSSGDVAAGPWCELPWDAHVKSYVRENIFFVKYEDVLAAPEQACQRIAKHLGVDLPQEQMRAAIRTQSFENAKRRFLARGDIERAEFLREGRSGVWRDRLTEEQRNFCEARFASTLSALGYVNQVQGGLL